MARRNDHSREELKTMIINSSWKIVSKHGLEGLTARRIAQDIGYAPGTIYNLFNSMEDLYLSLNAKTLDLLYDVLNDSTCNDPQKKPLQNMKIMAKHYMDFAQEYRPYWLMLFNLEITEDRIDTTWYSEKIDRLFSPLETLLSPYFSPKQTKKREMAARVLWASIHGLCFLQETGKIALVSKQNNTLDIADYLIDTFIKGLSK
ncbi:MAG: TetR/AcrR family transcriptional regulator [Alphaproteobacteria bacterium]|nr:TetR/AcrR family transcriptional regulator [Alphaproteobacteria bacterium]